LHTTIADVSLNSKAAIAVFSGTVSLTNTIIASHSVAISRTAGTVYEDYNLFFSVPTTSAGVVAHGGHSLSGDPKFVAPTSDDYHLGAGSAALNMAFPGLANSDFEGDSRPPGLGPDIGFDESGDAPLGPGLYLPLIPKN
jgi:serralysin